MRCGGVTGNKIHHPQKIGRAPVARFPSANDYEGSGCILAQTQSDRRDLSWCGLEIGCGAGRILRYLSAQAYTVVGIDIDPQLIQLCRELGAGPAHLVSWEGIEPLGPFDTQLLLNRIIGMGGDLAGVKRRLARCAASAASNGVLLFDSYEIGGPTGVLEKRLRYQ